MSYYYIGGSFPDSISDRSCFLMLNFIIGPASGQSKKWFWEGSSQIAETGASHPEFLLEPDKEVFL